jgi:hypothetical protein
MATSFGVIIMAVLVLIACVLLAAARNLLSTATLEMSSTMQRFVPYSKAQTYIVLGAPISTILGYFQVGGCGACGLWYAMSINFHVIALYCLKYAYLERVLFSADPHRAHEENRERTARSETSKQSVATGTTTKGEDKLTTMVDMAVPTDSTAADETAVTVISSVEYSRESTENAVYAQKEIQYDAFDAHEIVKAEMASPLPEHGDDTRVAPVSGTSTGGAGSDVTHDASKLESLHADTEATTAASTTRSSDEDKQLKHDESALKPPAHGQDEQDDSGSRSASRTLSATMELARALAKAMKKNETWHNTGAKVQRITLGSSMVTVVIAMTIIIDGDCKDYNGNTGCNLRYPMWIGILGCMILVGDCFMFYNYAMNILTILSGLKRVDKERVQSIKNELFRQAKWTIICLLSTFLDTLIGTFWVHFDNSMLVMADSLIVTVANIMMFSMNR